MLTPSGDGWTIEELAEQVADALAAGYAGVRSGRVRDVPDMRTIRYYTTLGLLDRPAAMRGRTAYYGQRHLLQLVAIKRLQAQGLTLSEVQRRLLGQANSVLARVAFPSAAGAAAETVSPPAGAGPPDSSTPSAPPSAAGPDAVRLTGDTALVLRPLRSLTDRDRRLIRMATAPLLELLRLNGLIGPEPPSQETRDEFPGDAADR
jgi:DNA-binding transcriptional MerR regulator